MPHKAPCEHFLLQINQLVDWAQHTLQPIGESGHSGQMLAVVKMLLLAHWYGMDEAALLEAYRDRISFRRFLGLPLIDNAADEVLDNAFRQQNGRNSMESQKLILEIEAQLLAKGIRVKPGTAGEATIIRISTPSTAHTSSMSDTIIAGPSEIKERKTRGLGILMRSAIMPNAEYHSDHTDSIVLSSPTEFDAVPLQASITWPWGAVTTLEHSLIVGRDQGSCPYAAELDTYQHLSRRHAELVACPLGIWVRDLQSRNGTFVNDERLPKGKAYLVESDAEIRFGPFCAVQLRIES